MKVIAKKKDSINLVCTIKLCDSFYKSQCRIPSLQMTREKGSKGLHDVTMGMEKKKINKFFENEDSSGRQGEPRFFRVKSSFRNGRSRKKRTISMRKEEV